MYLRGLAFELKKKKTVRRKPALSMGRATNHVKAWMEERGSPLPLALLLRMRMLSPELTLDSRQQAQDALTFGL